MNAPRPANPDGDAPAQKQGRFVWPPRKPSPDPLAGSTAHPATETAALPPLTPWQAFEHHWLVVAAPPLQRRLAEAAATPDALDAYCWRCGRTVGPFETDAQGCSHCRGTRPRIDRFVRLAEYTTPWDGIVQDAKFSKWPRLAQDLGRQLGRQCRAALPDLDVHPTWVVPVPTNFWRRLFRGTDHSLNLARGVAAELNRPLVNLLSRSRRPEQARLSATDRLSNLRESMGHHPLHRFLWKIRVSAARRQLPPGQKCRVILVDDISTTGATLKEASRAVESASKALKIKDLEIVAAVVCRTEQRRK